MTGTVRTRPLSGADWPAVEGSYADGIATGNATFQDTAPSWEEFDGGRIPGLRLVAVDGDGRVVGWATASPWAGPWRDNLLLERRSTIAGID